MPLLSINSHCSVPDSNITVYTRPLIYYTLLTLPCELELAWKSKFTLTGLLYFKNHYPAILGLLSSMFINNWNTSLQVSLKISDCSLPIHCWLNFVVCYWFQPESVKCWCTNRVCSSLAHLTDALNIVSGVGIQGQGLPFLPAQTLSSWHILL